MLSSGWPDRTDPGAGRRRRVQLSVSNAHQATAAVSPAQGCLRLHQFVVGAARPRPAGVEK
jgi:hypothetical protein